MPLDANKPKKRDYEKEQEEAKARIREAEEASGEKEVRQKNEGGYAFSWDEDTPGNMNGMKCLSKYVCIYV